MGTHADGTIVTHGRPARLRIAAGLGLMVVAVVLAWSAMAPDGAGVQAWVARQVVPESETISADQFQLVDVSVPEPGILWPATTVPGGVATRSLMPGQPLLGADLSTTAAAGQRRVTLPVEPDHLPDGLLPGDEVDVWTAATMTGPLIQAVVVQHVSPPDIGPGRVEVAVPADDVAAAVRAASSDGIILARLP